MVFGRTAGRGDRALARHDEVHQDLLDLLGRAQKVGDGGVDLELEGDVVLLQEAPHERQRPVHDLAHVARDGAHLLGAPEAQEVSHDRRHALRLALDLLHEAARLIVGLRPALDELRVVQDPVMGLLISCATPAASVPSESSFAWQHRRERQEPLPLILQPLHRRRLLGHPTLEAPGEHPPAPEDEREEAEVLDEVRVPHPHQDAEVEDGGAEVEDTPHAHRQELPPRLRAREEQPREDGERRGDPREIAEPERRERQPVAVIARRSVSSQARRTTSFCQSMSATTPSTNAVDRIS